MLNGCHKCLETVFLLTWFHVLSSPLCEWSIEIMSRPDTVYFCSSASSTLLACVDRFSSIVCQFFGDYRSAPVPDLSLCLAAFDLQHFLAQRLRFAWHQTKVAPIFVILKGFLMHDAS